jgi:hypothetical protein
LIKNSWAKQKSFKYKFISFLGKLRTNAFQLIVITIRLLCLFGCLFQLYDTRSLF